MPVKRKNYIFKCQKKTEKSCEIVSINISLDPDLLDCFGINCPVCGDPMINSDEAIGVLTCYLCEDHTNHGSCHLTDNQKKIDDFGMPSCCPYGLDVYADFTREPVP